jgi:hypothetical protein
MEIFEIKSGNTASSLIFSNRDGDYFNVKFESLSVKVSKRVWGYTDCEFLVNLFAFIAKEWKGWEGAQEWASIEGEFGVSATCDNLGHVMFTLTFREIEGSEEWEAKVQLGIDSTQTEKIAKHAGEFFGA